MIIYFNNKFSNNKNILIDVRDRGFLRGAAIFETILFNNHKIILFNYHYERFIKSIKKNYFNFSISKKKLEDIIYKLVKKNKIGTRRVAIRLTLSRGVSKARGLDFNNDHACTFLITLSNLATNKTIPKIRIKTSDIKRLSNSILSQNKTSNYFENIVAKHISKKEKFDDALLLNEKNKICCCSSSNIYFVENNKIFTPPLKDGALDGTVRKLLLKKKKVAVKSISLNNLKKVSEVFLTNSILGVRPVTKIDKILFDFGPKTKTIMKYSESLGI